jgi:K+-transporting ATPase ATPase C chain
MSNTIENESFMQQIFTSCRIVVVSMIICCVLYTLLILGIGQILTPYSANGSLVQNEKGDVIGSEVLAQGFANPKYFSPRPSAVSYNASATGGSNLSPTNPALRTRAEEILTKFKSSEGKLIPADLVTASGSGMDPNITLSAAEYQAESVALARGLPVASVKEVIALFAKKSGGLLTPEPLVNVLLLNIALDKLGK